MKEKIDKSVPAFATGPSRNPQFSIYRRRKGEQKFKKTPHCIYFYYIKFYPDKDPDIKHYYYDNGTKRIKIRDLPKLIRALGINARRKYGTPPQHGEKLQDIYWTRRCYLAMLIDNDIADAQFETNNAIEFYYGTVGSNHTFFDAKDFEVDLSPAEDGSQERSVVCCINHIKKNDAGDDLRYKTNGSTPDEQWFAFSVHHTGTYRKRLGPGGGPPPPDSGGTNMGPPVPPP